MAVTPKVQDDARQEVDRILRSETFRNSESQRRLFGYLADKSLAGESENLKEFTIGVDVFGKSSSYDPQQDASVRIQAGKLRQKIEEYYRTEGASDPVVVTFPKGRFKLTFEDRSPEASKESGRSWRVAALALGAVLAVVLVGWWTTATSARSDWAWNSALEEIWQPFLSGRPLLISLGTPLFVRHGDAFVRDPQANESIEGVPDGILQGLEKAYPGRPTSPVHIYTGIGEAKGAFELGRLRSARRPDVTIKGSNALSWEDIVANDVIFLGSPKYNPQLKDMPAGQTLVMTPGGIRNLRPQPGEPELLRGNWPPGSPYLAEDYALIARTGGLHGQGEMLILAASSTEGTLAAVQYVTQPAHAAELVRRVRGNAAKLPAHYEVVIHARFKAMVAVETEYRFHHVLN
jgi:hypothetical protein